MVFRIKDFPSFVALKSGFSTESVHMHGTEWYIRVELSRFNQAIGLSEDVAGTGYRAQWLDLHVVGKRSDKRKKSSFDVTTDFKFKNLFAPGMLSGVINSPDTFRFDFNSGNNYTDHMGIGLVKIDVSTI